MKCPIKIPKKCLEIDKVLDHLFTEVPSMIICKALPYE